MRAPGFNDTSGDVADEATLEAYRKQFLEHGFNMVCIMLDAVRD